MFILIKKILILGFICCISFILLAIGPGTYDADLSALIRKKELLTHTFSPKLILIGGSGLFYGIDSNKIENELHVKVVNLSMYAGCGSEFYSKFVPQYLNEGDFVLFIPEYIQYMQEFKLNDSICRKWAFVSVFPKSTSFLYENYRQRLIDLVELAVEKVRGAVFALFSLVNGISEHGSLGYSSKYSQNGDRLTGFWKTPNLTARDQMNFDRSIVNSKNFIKEFSNNVQAKKARFILAPPAVAYSWYSQQKKAIHSLFLNLEDFNVIGKPEDFVYQDTFFQDTIYHLDEVGRHLRTEKIISLLKDQGIFYMRRGSEYTSNGTVSPKKYDLISGFHEDRVFTRGDAHFYDLQYQLKNGQEYFVVTTMGWSPFKDNPQKFRMRALIDSQELSFIKMDGLSYWYKIPANLTKVNEIRLLSNTFRPIDYGMSNDGRDLGVDVQEVSFK